MNIHTLHAIGEMLTRHGLSLVLLLVSVLALASCDYQGKPVIKDRQQDKMVVTIVTYTDVHALDKAYREFNKKNGIDKGSAPVQGWANYIKNPKFNQCTLHVPLIESLAQNNKVTTWGHELLHCYYGQLHN